MTFPHVHTLIPELHLIKRTSLLLLLVDSCRRKHKSITELFKSKRHTYAWAQIKTDDVLLVHDVAEEQDRLDDDEDCKMNGG